MNKCCYCGREQPDGAAQASVAFPFLKELALTASTIRSAHDKHGDQLMCIWDDDVKAVEAALKALSMPSASRGTEA